MNAQRQKVLILYLASSALDTPVVAWSSYDGTGKTRAMAADSDEDVEAALLQDDVVKKEDILEHPVETLLADADDLAATQREALVGWGSLNRKNNLQ